MPKTPEIKDISRAAARGVRIERESGVAVKPASVLDPEFSAEMAAFAREVGALLTSGIERLGPENMASVALSLVVSLMRDGLSGDEVAFVLRQFADAQMEYFNEDAANG